MASQRASHDLHLSTAIHGDVTAPEPTHNAPNTPRSDVSNEPFYDKEAALVRAETKGTESSDKVPDDSFKTMRWW